MRALTRLILASALVSLVAVACGTAATTSPAPTGTLTQAATVTAAPTVATMRPTATPISTTDGEGPEHVVGTDQLTVTDDGTETVVGDTTQVRGQTIESDDTLNDPRVTGRGLVTLNADVHENVAASWGTYRLENADGAWEGTFTGGGPWDGHTTAVSGWLIGSGAYAGYTYYFHVYGPSGPYHIEGVIFPGSPPTP